MRGLPNDGHQEGHPARMEFTRLTMPVLIVSTEDDRFGTAQTASDIAAQLPQACLVIFPTAVISGSVATRPWWTKSSASYADRRPRRRMQTSRPRIVAVIIGSTARAGIRGLFIGVVLLARGDQDFMRLGCGQPEEECCDGGRPPACGRLTRGIPAPARNGLD